MIKRAVTLAMILVALTANASLSVAQLVKKSSTTSWDELRSVSTGKKLEVSMKSGETLKGEFVDVSDTTLTLVQNERNVNLDRNLIFRVYGPGKRSVARNALVGAAIGGGIGFGLGTWAYSQGDFVTSLIPAVGLFGTGVGAGIGAALGLRRSRRVIIYEAR